MRHLALCIIPSQYQQHYFMAAEEAAVWNLHTELSSETLSNQNNEKLSLPERT
jgi:hypothetical protein